MDKWEKVELDMPAEKSTMLTKIAIPAASSQTA